MSAKISLVTGQITINDGGSFLLTAADGSIDDHRAQGFFVRDTRLISFYEISIDRQLLSPLTSSNITHRVARYEFTNPELLTATGTVPAKKILISVRRDIIGGMHEDIDLVNHHQERVEIQLMLAIRSDFVDLSRIKAKKLITQGRMETTWENDALTNTYRNGEFTRGLRIQAEGASSPPRYSNGRLVFDIALDPGGTWHTCIDFIALVDGEELVPKHLDSGDAIRTADGSIVDAPIALCETQGQVYDAWRRAADLYDVRGQPARAQVLRQKADDLYQRFNERFWMEDEGFYCLGLDGNKQQIRSIASNAGQLLWSGIVPIDRAKRLVERLFQPDLWCGWGIRTLSAKHPAYDPLAKPLR